MNKKGVLPKFASESAEARWVFRNQRVLAEALELGKGPHLTVEQIVARSRSRAKRKRILLELSATDLSLVRKLASSARLRQREYLARLLRQAIRGESQRQSRRA